MLSQFMCPKITQFVAYSFPDFSSKTGDDLIAMGSSLVGLTTENIASISNEAFEEAVTTIGKINGFTQEQLDAWAALAKKVNPTNVDMSLYPL